MPSTAHPPAPPEAAEDAAARRRGWRASIATAPAWLVGDADVSHPTDTELDAIWEAGGRVDSARPFAAAHLLAAYRAGRAHHADPPPPEPVSHPATAVVRLRALVEAYRGDPRYHERAAVLPIFTAPGAPLYLADVRAVLELVGEGR